VSLSFDQWIRPLFAAKPKLQIVASKSNERPGEAIFSITNAGTGPVEDVSVTIWASAPFSPRTDIFTVKHAGGVSDANCELGIYQARLTGADSTSRPNAFNTPARAILIRCTRVNPKETWHGRLEYVGQEAVFGLTANIKSKEISKNQYAMFDHGANR
jgi:hypothetical protein